MKDPRYHDWLLQNGGPVIRYLTALEQEGFKTANTLRLQHDLLKSEQVKYWMKNITGRTGFNDIHGSRDACFENAMGKLTLYGLRKGMGDFDPRCAPYLDWLQRSMNENRPNIISVFHQTVVAAWLAVAGFLSEPPVRNFVLSRLCRIHDFVREKDFSIYVDKSRFKRVPATFERYPLINPDLYIDGNFVLPWIYDIFAFGALQVYMKDDEVSERIEHVISYLLDRRYQQFHEGYGIVLNGNCHYNVMGWGVWLPCYDGLHKNPFNKGCLVQRLELMSHFKTGRSSGWFVENLKMLEDFENHTCRYVIPKNYISEKKNSYFVTGAHMGFGENRRRRVALEIESSFWMLKIMGNKPEKDMTK